MSAYLIQRLHERHVETRRFEPACLLCVEAQAKRPSWVQRLGLNAREFGTRRALA